MDRLIQMRNDLGYEGKKLQDFVKQQQDYDRGERIAERELERDRIESQEKERGIGSWRKIRKGNLKGIGSWRKKKIGKSS